METSVTTVNYTLCVNVPGALSAIGDLSRYPLVLLDCEGKTIGKVNGVLSLLCIGTPETSASQRIYVFDVPALKYTPAQSAIAAFLARQDIVKVVWDGRMDFLELHEVFGVDTARMLDLQIVEVLGRERVLCETDQMRLARLANVFGDVAYDEGCSELFRDMHVIMGMKQAMQTYAPDIPMQKDAAVEEIHKRNQSVLWLVRPVPFALLLYAAIDIRLIACLLSRLTSLGFLSKEIDTETTLLAASTRYVARTGLTERVPWVHKTDPHQQHNLLLRDALFPPPDTRPESCAQCHLNLPLTCYEQDGLLRKEHCRICVAGDLKTFADRTKLISTWIRMPEREARSENVA
ncbi:hypothetical protein PENSPDRAFT_581778 [Peniophora sp. CONT]|nr:hypothetical protein PENSPDRAFT_581778 [Peniophora sp. CONT]